MQKSTTDKSQNHVLSSRKCQSAGEFAKHRISGLFAAWRIIEPAHNEDVEQTCLPFLLSVCDYSVDLGLVDRDYHVNWAVPIRYKNRAGTAEPGQQGYLFLHLTDTSVYLSQ